MKLKIKSTIEELTYDANDWELYSSEYGSEESAKRLNEAVIDAVNSSDTANEASQKVEPAFALERDFGASDSEPRWHLRNILRKVYGEDSI